MPTTVDNLAVGELELVVVQIAAYVVDLALAVDNLLAVGELELVVVRIAQ